MTISGPDEMQACVAHCDLMAQCTHVDVGNPSLAAFVAELMATLANPGGCMGEFGR